MDLKQTEQALFGNLQRTIDGITEKAQRRAAHEISFREKFFLQMLYGGIVAGGKIHGLPEAAQLLHHYLGKSGKPLEVNSEIYRNSHTVKVEMENQKRKIADNMRRGQVEFSERSGKLIAEQTNLRLKYADNRFLLHSVTKKGSGGLCDTTWKVEETYDFEDFKGGPSNWKLVSKWSEFPFRGHRVRVYDGLSRYLVHLGMAKEFDYYATWMEHWKY